MMVFDGDAVHPARPSPKDSLPSPAPRSYELESSPVEPTALIVDEAGSPPPTTAAASAEDKVAPLGEWSGVRRGFSRTASSSSFEDVLLFTTATAGAGTGAGGASEQRPSGEAMRPEGGLSMHLAGGSPRSAGGKVHDVAAYRPDNTKRVLLRGRSKELGIRLHDSCNQTLLPGAFISRIAPGSLAAQCKGLEVGDQVVSINGSSVVCLPLKQIMHQLRASVRKGVELGIVRPTIVYEHELVRPDASCPFGLELAGPLIRGVEAGSIAERAGVRPNHYITQINDTPTVDVPEYTILDLIRAADSLCLRTMPAHVFATLAKGD